MCRLFSFLKTSWPVLGLSIALLLIANDPSMAGPDSASTESTEGAENRLEEIHQEISKAKERAAGLDADEAAAVQELERLNFELHRSKAMQRQTAQEIKKAEQAVDTLAKERAEVLRQIEDLEEHVTARLVAYYKLTNLGTASLLFSADSFFDLLQRRNDLEHILKADDDLWNRFQERNSRLERLSKDIASEKEALDRLWKGREMQQSAMVKKTNARSDVLAKIRAERDLVVASIASLKEASKKLDAAIEQLGKEPELEPEPGLDAAGTLTRFAALKGALPMPVQGEVVGFFGPYKDEKLYDVESFRNGVNFGVHAGAPVHAVCDGQVVYAQWFKGYGNVVIIDHGEHYYSLSAQLDEILKRSGDPVLKGEAIGTVGDMGTLSGPGLYFELRHHGKPMDPMVWLRSAK